MQYQNFQPGGYYPSSDNNSMLNMMNYGGINSSAQNIRQAVKLGPSGKRIQSAVNTAGSTAPYSMGRFANNNNMFGGPMMNNTFTSIDRDAKSAHAG